MPPDNRGAEPIRRLRPALGTLVRIEARAPVAAIDAAYLAIERVEASMSFHRVDSELRRLMRAPAGDRIAVGSDLHRVLAFAKRVWKSSGGVFDPAIARTLVAQGLLPRPEGPAPDAAASFRDLEILGANHVRLARPLWIDLGGIAKGYAVDEALRVLRDRGAQAASVNAGGDVACFGPACRIALRDPRSPHAVGPTIELRDAALATSGAYFQPEALRGRRGNPSMRRDGSVTVIAHDCMTADALTKVVWAAPRMAPRLLEAFGAQALSLDARAQPRWLNAA
jgi:thiamine biosynthesis lipoprotein